MANADIYDEVMIDIEDRMQKTVQHLGEELKGIRTGRATPALVDSIRVEYYGSPTPLGQMATVSIPEPRMIVIKPYDVSVLKEIEKSIQKSDLGLNPSNDGKIIRLSIPPLSAEQRKKLAARVRDLGEESRVSLRNTRRDGIKQGEAAQKSGDLSEDALASLKEDIQGLIKTYEGKVDKIIERKIEEIMEV